MDKTASYIGFIAVFSATVVALVVFSATIVRAFVQAPTEETEVALLTPPVVPLDLPEGARRAPMPARLWIPAIGLSSVIQHVGVAPSGNMAVPNAYADVGWYRYGATPGSEGSAVIAGHVDNGIGLPGVFHDLSALEKGDEVIVRAVDGTERRFAVVRTEVYRHDEVPTEALFNRSDGRYLNLITCVRGLIGGKWVYDHRVVVYTELIG